jgi:rhodanese-related sulfurtransferase
MTTTATITPEMTMEQILAIAPSAQRALFQRYHIGGCSSCGFQPTDTLAQVCKDHNLLDVKEVVRTIHQAHEVDSKLQVEPRQVQAWLQAKEPFSFLDVRTPEEWKIARIPGSELLDYDDPGKYMNLPKDRRIVFTCHSGVRSLDVAAYFAGHGFTQVSSMRGGIDAWSTQIDPSIPRY